MGTGAPPSRAEDPHARRDMGVGRGAGGAGAVTSELVVSRGELCKNREAAPPRRLGAAGEGRGARGLLPDTRSHTVSVSGRALSRWGGSQPWRSWGIPSSTVTGSRGPPAGAGTRRRVSRPRPQDRVTPARFSGRGAWGLTVPAGEDSQEHGCPCAVPEGAARRLIYEECVNVVWEQLAPSY